MAIHRGPSSFFLNISHLKLPRTDQQGGLRGVRGGNGCYDCDMVKSGESALRLDQCVAGGRLQVLQLLERSNPHSSSMDVKKSIQGGVKDLFDL